VVTYPAVVLYRRQNVTTRSIAEMLPNFQFFSIRKRTREGHEKEMAVAHTDVRWREGDVHGRIFVPEIEEMKGRRQLGL